MSEGGGMGSTLFGEEGGSGAADSTSVCVCVCVCVCVGGYKKKRRKCTP